MAQLYYGGTISLTSIFQYFQPFLFSDLAMLIAVKGYISLNLRDQLILIRREVMAKGFAPVLEPEKKVQQPTTRAVNTNQ
jgi:hypothetical protein